MIDFEKAHFPKWAWILLLLKLLQLLLYVLEDKGKIHIFGPSVTIGEFMDGKRILSNSEPQENSNPEEVQGMYSFQKVNLCKERLIIFHHVFQLNPKIFPKLLPMA